VRVLRKEKDSPLFYRGVAAAVDVGAHAQGLAGTM
jgi:hypothetical protein